MILSDSESTRQKAAEIVARGGVVSFRTDTFYGLGANPFNAAAIQKIIELKGREGRKPILVVISDPDQVDRLIAQRSGSFEKLMQRLWPGPLTIIGAAALALPTELTSGTKTLGVRLPDDDKVRALVSACGGVLTATSANPSGEMPARSADEAERYFGDRIDLIVEGGPAKTDRPSTVVDATTDEVTLVREGVIAWADIHAVIETT